MPVILRLTFYFEYIDNYNPRIVIAEFGKSFEKRRRDFKRRLYRFPPINNAKMLCEYLFIQLELGLSPMKIYSLMAKWQSLEMTKKNILLYVKKLSYLVVNKAFPLEGIRIIISGSSRKASRKKKTFYHLFLRKDSFYKNLPFNSPVKYTQYYQLQAKRMASVMGLRVWLFFRLVRYVENFPLKVTK